MNRPQLTEVALYSFTHTTGGIDERVKKEKNPWHSNL